MSNATTKLESLIKRQEAVKAALRAEREKKREKEDREDERVKSIVGGVLLKFADEQPNFKNMIKSVLRTTDGLPESHKRLLRLKDLL